MRYAKNALLMVALGVNVVCGSSRASTAPSILPPDKVSTTIVYGNLLSELRGVKALDTVLIKGNKLQIKIEGYYKGTAECEITTDIAAKLLGLKSNNPGDYYIEISAPDQDGMMWDIRIFWDGTYFQSQYARITPGQLLVYITNLDNIDPGQMPAKAKDIELVKQAIEKNATISELRIDSSNNITFINTDMYGTSADYVVTPEQAAMMIDLCNKDTRENPMHGEIGSSNPEFRDIRRVLFRFSKDEYGQIKIEDKGPHFSGRLHKADYITQQAEFGLTTGEGLSRDDTKRDKFLVCYKYSDELFSVFQRFASLFGTKTPTDTIRVPITPGLRFRLCDLRAKFFEGAPPGTAYSLVAGRFKSDKGILYEISLKFTKNNNFADVLSLNYATEVTAQ